MRLSPKARLGPYEILGPLGAGGMGEVYRAMDLRLGRQVALKVLPSEVAESAERLARFEREARTVAALNHPNIITLYSVEDEDGIRFLTMELVEGEPLSALVAAGGLPFDRILEVAIPLTDALVAAHAKGVIHRDLKPGNVMVTADGRVKVLDFGLAKTTAAEGPVPGAPLGATLPLSVSGEGQILGTVPYMAPEQLRGEPADARSDLFALGIILHELATGARPFGGTTRADVGAAILRDSPQPMTRLRPDLPPEFERLVLACLEKDPGRRVASARDLAKELRGLPRDLEWTASGRPGFLEAASIAVLPFVNRSAGADDEYFSDGLTDELLGTLAKIRGLRVAARTSSFRFKGTTDDIATIGRRLKVATLLEGSVRKSGSRVRISVQLVKVSDGYQLWSETYDRTLDDIFAVQDDIAQSVVKELRGTLLGEEAVPPSSGVVMADVAKAARGRSTDPEAHRLYLLARYLLDRWTPDDTAKAIGYLQEALARDPRFAAAWGELSRAHVTEAACGWTTVAEGNVRAREAAARALALDPELESGHLRMGWIQMTYDWDWQGAQVSLARALAAAPNSEMALHMAAVLARNLGNLEQAIALNRRAIVLDPIRSETFLNLGLNLFAADRHAEAEAAFRQSLEFAPDGSVAHASLAMALLAQGRIEESLAEALREPEDLIRLYGLAIVYAGLGRHAEADAALEELSGKYAENAATQIAEVHAVRGEADAAFDWLERAYVQRDGGLTEMKASPHFRSLHGDPRWRSFLGRMGFTE